MSVDNSKAKQDAEWLAGSEADTAERNLARAYLAMCDEVAGFEAMWEAREQAHDAERAEAKREEWRNVGNWLYSTYFYAKAGSVDWMGLNTFELEAAYRYPATPSGEGVAKVGHDDNKSLAWQSSTPGPAGSGRAAIDAEMAAHPTTETPE